MVLPEDGALIQAEHNCPQGSVQMRLQWRMVARKIGTFSLAGQQMKFSAVRCPFLICDACGLSAQGKPVNRDDRP